MHSFKGGDVVRRIGNDFGGVRVGETYVVSNNTGNLSLLLRGYSKAYTAEKFVLVEAFKAEKTNKELADEYRTIATRIREVRSILSDRGFTLMVEGNSLPVQPYPVIDVSKYYFKKTIEEKL